METPTKGVKNVSTKRGKIVPITRAKKCYFGLFNIFEIFSVPEITTQSAVPVTEVIETVTDDASSSDVMLPTTEEQDEMVTTEHEDEENTTLDPIENEISDDFDASKQQDEEVKGAKMESVPIILATCAGLFCIILLAVYTVVQRRKKINIDLEENMAQSMKNLEAQNNLIEESEESTDNEDYTDNGQDVNPMKYKGSFAYDPQ